MRIDRIKGLVNVLAVLKALSDDWSLAAAYKLKETHVYFAKRTSLSFEPAVLETAAQTWHSNKTT